MNWPKNIKISGKNFEILNESERIFEGVIVINSKEALDIKTINKNNEVVDYYYGKIINEVFSKMVLSEYKFYRPINKRIKKVI